MVLASHARWGSTGAIARTRYNFISQNPHRLAGDIRGVEFLTADKVAERRSIEKTEMIRVRAGISYALAEAIDEDHCGLPSARTLCRWCGVRTRGDAHSCGDVRRWGIVDAGFRRLCEIPASIREQTLVRENRIRADGSLDGLVGHCAAEASTRRDAAIGARLSAVKKRCCTLSNSRQWPIRWPRYSHIPNSLFVCALYAPGAWR